LIQWYSENAHIARGGIAVAVQITERKDGRFMGRFVIEQRKQRFFPESMRKIITIISCGTLSPPIAFRMDLTSRHCLSFSATKRWILRWIDMFIRITRMS